MALFDRFKQGQGGEGGDGADGGGDKQRSGFEPQPEKAEAFFKHASTAHDTTNYEYAVTMWLQGLRFDPDNTDALDGFEQSMASWINKLGKAKGPSKGQKDGVKSDGGPGKYAHALLHWGGRGFDWGGGLRAMQSANKLGADEAAFWVGARVFAKMANDAKAKKGSWVELMTEFEECSGWDMAVKAGEIAIRLDPTDGQLAQRVKNLSAQQAMATGGFDESGKEGAFRSRIRDKEKQQELSQEDSLVKDEGSLAQQIQRARKDLERRPDDLGAIQKLTRLLRQRGTFDDLKLAYNILKKGHETTQNYRLKQEAGEIELRVISSRIRDAEEALAKRPEDAELAGKIEKLRAKRREIELREITEQVAAYPTDLTLKFRLGKLHFESGQYEDAIGQLQEAKNAQGVQGQVMHLLGLSFLNLGWANEAEATFRGALERHRTHDDELGMELRYGLMRSLKAKAEAEHDSGAADEAFDIASKIAVQQINFKEIRAVRDDLTELRKKLKEG